MILYNLALDSDAPRSARQRRVNLFMEPMRRPQTGIAGLYDEFVVAHGLERRETLAAVRSLFDHEPSVLYPGCFYHVTPSFYFQHVIYVDRAQHAADYFRDVDGLFQLIRANKVYRADPYVRFIKQDYEDQLTIESQSVDLLLSLFAPGITKACWSYIRPGGLLLTNNHRGDALEALRRPELKLIAVLNDLRGRCDLSNANLDEYLVSKRHRSLPGAETNERLKYKRIAHYYLFRRDIR